MYASKSFSHEDEEEKRRSCISRLCDVGYSVKRHSDRLGRIHPID